MKISKTFVSALAGAAILASSASAQSSNDYIKTFGQWLFESNGFAELQLTPAEFELLAQGFKEAYEGKKLPENM